jgi:hypothetical protein
MFCKGIFQKIANCEEELSDSGVNMILSRWFEAYRAFLK